MRRTRHWEEHRHKARRAALPRRVLWPCAAGKYKPFGGKIKTPATGPGFLLFLKLGRLRRNLRLILGRLAQHVAAAPHRFDVVFAVRGVGEFFAELADEDVDNLQLRLVHAAIEMIEE